MMFLFESKDSVLDRWHEEILEKAYEMRKEIKKLQKELHHREFEVEVKLPVYEEVGKDAFAEEIEIFKRTIEELKQQIDSKNKILIAYEKHVAKLITVIDEKVKYYRLENRGI